MKPARLSRQTILTTNQSCRPPTLSLYAKSAADLRQAGGGTRGRERPTFSRQRKLDASAVMNAKVPDQPALPQADAPARRDLPPAARRALEEAAARRAEPKPAAPREFNGRGGPDPVRYGDWEVKGLASDF